MICGGCYMFDSNSTGTILIERPFPNSTIESYCSRQSSFLPTTPDLVLSRACTGGVHPHRWEWFPHSHQHAIYMRAIPLLCKCVTYTHMESPWYVRFRHGKRLWSTSLLASLSEPQRFYSNALLISNALPLLCLQVCVVLLWCLLLLLYIHRIIFNYCISAA